jgi:hypothetical protein
VIRRIGRWFDRWLADRVKVVDHYAALPGALLDSVRAGLRGGIAVVPYALADGVVSRTFARIEKRTPWDANEYYLTNFFRLNKLDLQAITSAIELLREKKYHSGWKRTRSGKQKYHSAKFSRRTLIVGLNSGLYELLLAVGNTAEGCPIEIWEPGEAGRKFVKRVLGGDDEFIDEVDENRRLHRLNLYQELIKHESILVALGGDRYIGVATKALKAFQCGNIKILDGSIFKLPKGAYDLAFMFYVAESITWWRWIAKLAFKCLIESADYSVIAAVTGDRNGYPAGKGTRFPNAYMLVKHFRRLLGVIHVFPGTEQHRAGVTFTVFSAARSGQRRLRCIRGLLCFRKAVDPES